MPRKGQGDAQWQKGDMRAMHYDLAVVGGGILGLAHAWHAARAGLRVAVFERHEAADRATVRNFGMLALMAQRPGAELRRARATLADWREVAAGAGLSMRRAGCLFAARSAAEMAVLRDAAEGAGDGGHDLRPLTPQAALALAPGLRREGLLGALHSLDAWKLDQRGAPAAIACWLARDHGVTFHFGAEVLDTTGGAIETRAGRHGASHVVICSGDEFRTLYPEAWEQSGVGSCRLQMLRMAPQPGGFRLDPFVLGGLSLPRYGVFADCPSLPDLRAEQRALKARALAHDVHLIAVQEADGSLTVGDSHHDAAGPPPHPQEVEETILAELHALLALDRPYVAGRWVGSYARRDDPDGVLRLQPEALVTAVTVTNGQGMTHGFAIARGIIAEIAQS